MTIRKWNRGHLPSADAERRAKAWLANRKNPTPEASADMLVVVCPSPDVATKARRLLTFIGCEVETI